MNTTSHNIANVNTPGYSRQSAYQVVQQPVQFGAGWMGTGVQVREITRSYSDLLAGQVRAAQSQAARSSAYAENVTQLNALLGDPHASVANAMSGFFASMQSLSTQPGDVALRQAVYANAQSLVQRFRGVDGSLTAQREQINQRLGNLVTEVNSRTQQIADISTRIVAAYGSGHTPNDLLDQRDAMLNELNQLASISVTGDADGSINVYLSNGQALVNGTIVHKLEMMQNPLAQGAPVPGVRVGSGVVSLAANGEIGGEIGGLLAVRDEALTSVETSMGRLARVFTDALNSRNHLGLDLSGNPGGDIFSMAPPAVAAAGNNTGSATIAASVSDASALKASDYQIEVTASGYTVTRLSDKQQQNFSGSPIDIDGLQFNVSGGGVVGDKFSVRSASGALGTLRVALGDAYGIATASPLRIDANTANAGNASASIVVNADDPALHDPAQLTFDGVGNVTITTGTGSTVLPYTPGSPISLNGWSVTVRGTPAAGDAFQIGANTAVIGDNRNVMALAGLETAETLPGMSFSGAYSALVVDIGSKGRDAQATRAASEGLAASLRTTQESVSGVNLDEEAINLMRYQQAYQAAARMLSVANAMFESVLAISR